MPTCYLTSNCCGQDRGAGGPSWLGALSGGVEDVNFLTTHRSVQEFSPVCMPRLHATEGVGGEKELAAPVGEAPA